MAMNLHMGPMAQARRDEGLTPTVVEMNKLAGMVAAKADLDQAANIGVDQELTASGAVLDGVQVLRLNHASTIIAATMAATTHRGFFAVVDTSATGTAAHTLTLTGGTFNGTNTIATLNALGEALMLHFDENGRGTVITNTGAVALS